MVTTPDPTVRGRSRKRNWRATGLGSTAVGGSPGLLNSGCQGEAEGSDCSAADEALSVSHLAS
jgi:hypothetical protein